MIIKQYVPRTQSDPRLKAGVDAEKQMAHYLNRQFGDSKRFHVLHDVRFSHEGENAQIDHIVVHPFGVAIVESKSVSTAVRINSMNEWERLQGLNWTGMPNPLLQAERQGKLLKSMLQSREAELLDKVLGLAQGTFFAMAVDTYAAISDRGRIDRASDKQAPNALKADAVPSAIENVVADYRRASSLLTLNVRAIATAPRDFNSSEQMRIARFLDAVDRSWRAEHSRSGSNPSSTGAKELTKAAVKTRPSAGRSQAPRPPVILEPVCKYCGSRGLDAKTGSYSPYAKCRACDKNTSIRVVCQNCNQKVYLTRDAHGFSGSCEGCSLEHQVYL